MNDDVFALLMQVVNSVELNWGPMPRRLDRGIYTHVPLHDRYARDPRRSLEVGDHRRDLEDVREAIRTDSCSPHHIAQLGELLIGLSHEMLQAPSVAGVPEKPLREG